MTEPNRADTKAALARLTEEGKAIILTRPAQVATVLDGSLEECARLAAENAELRERLQAIRQTVFPYLREPNQRGDLARDVEAEADPQPEPGEVTP